MLRRIGRFSLGLLLLTLGVLGYYAIYQNLFGYPFRYWSNVTGALIFATVFLLFGIESLTGRLSKEPEKTAEPAPKTTEPSSKIYNLGCLTLIIIAILLPALTYYNASGQKMNGILFIQKIGQYSISFSLLIVFFAGIALFLIGTD